MIGIGDIGVYIPETRVSNYDRKSRFGIDDYFIENKIGIRSVARKKETDEASDLCLQAYRQLEKRTSTAGDIELLVVVTQNPDQNIPHVSAIVHGALGLDESCACFDISLGCSGYVYALSVVKSFMEENGLKSGLLFTADPYSKIVDDNDKNTTLLFGDAATVTLLTDAPKFSLGKFVFGTIGSEYGKLICNDGTLHMNGRGVFNFAAKVVPGEIGKLMAKNGLQIEDVDTLLIHQGSRIIVDTIRKNIGINEEKVPFGVADYGNTVSSSIPILLQDELESAAKVVAMSGFGVGLSMAHGVLRKLS